ncbi:DUF5719 family protein [Microbacterium sp. MYb62]|uniref:DUF5719 family protein n=1 Tax=Microbacterium sp. MYb62 TaxID=1848690 RepID=UPI000CFC9F6E|nr:DUF5719 family protein [Microbacterium sp. MYb62]PRB15124.1 hypothetical protein CQ042_09240 [Microbacterium sp. MYb62]
MSSTRAFRVAATGARVVTGVVVAAACVLGVATAVHAPWPVVRHDPAQVAVTPLPGDSTLVCNGDLRALGRDPSAPLDMRSAASASLTIGGTSGDPASEGLPAQDLEGAGEAQVLTGAVEGRSAPLIAGAESITVAADDLAGYAALPCGTPRLESWLVGGSTGTGTEDIVILTNAAEVPSTVTLMVYGNARSTRTVVVPARSQVALPLTSFAAGNENPVVKVTAAGAPVRAVLQSSLIRVLDPAGIDLQDAVAGPQQNLVLTGVESFVSAGDDAEMAVLRVLSPGADAAVSVQVRAEGTAAVVDEFSVPLEADLPTQVSLSGLEPGRYTVEVDADVPVVAAVRQQDGFGLDSDFAWVTPAPEIDTDVVFAVPSGPAPRLQLANSSAEDATITLEPLDGGQPQELVIAAGATKGIAVTARTTYRLQMTGPVHAAVTLSAPGAVAVLPLRASAGAERPITVYP